MLMKKFLLSVYAGLVMGVLMLWSAPVDEDAARSVAMDFMAGMPSLRSSAQGGEPLVTAYVDTRTDGSNRFYVFNRGKGNGFIIVSGDDRAEPVLGYAGRGAFMADSIPPNLRWWLEQYAVQIDALQHAPARLTVNRMKLTPPDGFSTCLQPRQVRTDAEVEPLLDDIVWGQLEPFNRQAPFIGGKRAPAGCVATAATQIMRYWQHPVQGTGSHSYVVNGQTLSADFGSTRYDWDNMWPYYGGISYTQAQADAVATLMYHYGVAVEMGYGADESSAYDHNAIRALYRYFGYDGGMKLRMREGYSVGEWETLVRDELDAARPVYYSGQAPEGGHAFVCDGYDADGYFHINWGWNGLYNGYFLLHALEPAGQGTGGYEGGYNSNQGIATGVQPSLGQVPSEEVRLVSPGLIVANGTQSQGSALSLSTELVRTETWTKDDVGFNLGVLFYGTSDTQVASVTLNGRFELPTASHYYENLDWRLYFPGDLPDGDYELVFAFSAGSGWQPVKVPDNVPPVMAHVEDGTITVSGGTQPGRPLDYRELFVLRSGLECPDKVSQYEEFTLTAVIENKDKHDFKGEIYLRYTDTEGRVLFHSPYPQVCSIPAGGQQTITLADNVGKALEPGRYLISLVYNTKADDPIPFDNGNPALDLEVIQGEAPAWKVMAAQTTPVPGQLRYDEDDFMLNTAIQNTGADFKGRLCVRLEDGSGNLYGESPATAVQLPGGGAVTPLSLSCKFDIRPRYREVAYIKIVFKSLGEGEVLPYDGPETIPDVWKLPALYLLRERTVYDRGLATVGEFSYASVLRNDGTDPFNAEFALELKSMTDYDKVYFSPSVPVNVPAGGEAPIVLTGHLNGELDRGLYSLRVVVMNDGVADQTISYDDDMNTVVNLDLKTEIGGLTLVQDKCEYVTECKPGESYSLFPVLRNDGEEDVSDFLAAAVLSDESSEKTVYMEFFFVDLKKGEENTFPVYWCVPENVPPGRYLFQYKVPSENKIFFTPFPGQDEDIYITVTENTTSDPDKPAVHLVEASTRLPETVPASGSFTASTVLKNNGTGTFSAEVVLVMLDQTGRTLLYNSYPYVSVTVPAGGETPLQITGNLQGKVPAGNYIFAFATVEGNDLTDFLPLESGNRFFPVTVEDGTTPEPALEIVEAESGWAASFVRQTDYPMNVTLRNDGQTFKGDVYALLWDGKGTLYHQQAIPIDLAQGQKKNFTYTWNVPASVPTGRCVFSYARIVGGYYEFIPMDDEQGTTGIYVMIEASAGALRLNLVSDETVIPAVIYQNTGFTASTVLQNAGGSAFKGDVCFLIVDAEGYPKYYTRPFRQVEVPAGSSVPLSFDENVELLAPGDYLAGFATVENSVPTLIEFEDGMNVVPVKVQAAPSGVAGVEAAGKPTLFPNPAEDFVMVRISERMHRVCVHSLTGLLMADEVCADVVEHRMDLSRLPQGTYLLTAATESGVHTVRLLKR